MWAGELLDSRALQYRHHMASRSGHTAAALNSAVAAVSVRDHRLAHADHELCAAIAAVYRVATESIQQLDEISAQITAAVIHSSLETPYEAREFSRFLISQQRAAADIVAYAQRESEATAARLRQLIDQYQVSSYS